MRKLLLLIAVFAGFLSVSISQIQAQCTPSPLFVAIGIPGVYPNPVQQPDLASGTMGAAYSETITVITLADTTIDLSGLIGFPVPPVTASIAYHRVDSITGLPGGLTSGCSPVSCSVPGDSSGCVGISGTPTTSGVYTVVMNSVIGIEVPAAVPVLGGTTVDLPVPGTSWDMQVAAVAIEDLQDDGFVLQQNAPNPFHGTTEISFFAPKPAQLSFEVFDLAGKRMHSESLRARTGDNILSFDASGFAPGIYLYQISDGQKQVTSKMVVQ